MEDKTSALISALALLKARQAGIIDENISNLGIGILGSLKASATNTIVRLANNEINKEEAVGELKDAVGRTLHLFVSKALDIIHIQVTNLTRLIPYVGPLVSSAIAWAYHQHKENIASKVVSVIKDIGSKVKNFLFG